MTTTNGYCSFSLVPLSEKEVKTDWRVSSSNRASKESSRGDSSEGLVRLQHGEIKQLRMRLQSLEEDTEVMKEIFFGCVKERKELINEISYMFQIVQQHLRNQVTGGEKSMENALILGPSKYRSPGPGLSQVLHQDLNPALATRVLRPNIFAFQDPTEAMYKCSNS